MQTRSDPHFLVRALKRLLPAAERARLDHIAFNDAGHGYDIFGLSPEWIGALEASIHVLYTHYFRVVSHQPHHLPVRGPAILAANHSGMLPVDAVMLYLDVLP